MVQDKNAQKIVVLTHNPKGEWGDVRPKIEADNGYKGWGTSFNLELNQCVVIYISSDVRQYRYVMKVVKTYKGYIDLELVCKIDSKDSELLSYEKLKEHGLKPSTVNYTLSNNRNKELYLYVMKILEKSIAGQCNSHETSLISYDIEKSALNQILYGPPGTGKTYHTIDKALEIIDGEVPESRAEAKERFETLKETGQIEFVTFHQSYGYEEFVEGIKADVKSETIRYVIEDGIFKSLSDKARKHFEDSQKSQSEIASEISQKDKIGDFLNKALEDEKVFQKTKGGKFGIKDLTEKSIILYSEDSNYNENSITLDVGEFYKIINANIEFKTSRQIAQEVFGISNQRQKDTYYLSLYKEYKKVPFAETRINADIIENKNYLLIIDEINRGNISKIFGELITLIEESKRLGNDEAMEVTLPYSGEKFGVPKNLYIIGTMNTADRSIALMDTALRRRFEFVEMMPSYDVIKKEVGDNGMIDGIDIASMLEKINKRIEYLYDRDHTIGHAYFLKAKDKPSLDSVMRNQVIPLLQEYFYDDWEKIRLVLNDGFIIRTKQDASTIFDKDMDDEYIEEDKYTYSIASDFHEDAYRKIYGKIEQIQVGESHE